MSLLQSAGEFCFWSDSISLGTHGFLQVLSGLLDSPDSSVSSNCPWSIVFASKVPAPQEWSTPPEMMKEAGSSWPPSRHSCLQCPCREVCPSMKSLSCSSLTLTIRPDTAVMHFMGGQGFRYVENWKRVQGWVSCRRQSCAINQTMRGDSRKPRWQQENKWKNLRKLSYGKALSVLELWSLRALAFSSRPLRMLS